MIDATASMNDWLSAAKLHTRTIVERFGMSHDLEIAAVFYRDFSETYIVVPFTSNIAFFESAIADIEPFGGGDTCEDVAGAFARMHQLDWTGVDIRTCFLICDSPPHGLRWHTNEVSDDHEYSDYGLAELVFHTAMQEIDLTILHINETLSTMIRRMTDIYRSRGLELRVEPFSPTQDPCAHTLVDMVSQRIEDSVQAVSQQPIQVYTQDFGE
jgi:hypothetical protein